MLNTLINMGNIITNYNGNVKDGKRHGFGCQYHDSDMKIKLYEGEFVDNKYHGFGKLYDEFGTLHYEGNFQHGKYHGSGKTYTPDLSRIYRRDMLLYKGNWKNGCMDGLLEIYNDKNLVVRCIMKNNKIDGKFMLFGKNYIMCGKMYDRKINNANIIFENGDNYFGCLRLIISNFMLIPDEESLRDYITNKNIDKMESDRNLYDQYNKSFDSVDILSIDNE